MKALIIGCGYLGWRVAKAWKTLGHDVSAVTRSLVHAEAFSEDGIRPIMGEVQTISDLPLVDTVLYAVGFDRGGGKSMREVYVDGLRQVCDRLPAPSRFVYVSSTSVYGHRDGSSVEENAPTEPVDESGRIVLDAEALVPFAIKLRFAGIYGPGRLLGRKTLAEGSAFPGDPEKWLNLIHVDDGVRAVLKAATHGGEGEIVNVADDSPPTRREFYSELAGLLQLDPPKFSGEPSLRDTHRRICNDKLRQQWKVELAYPSYRSGLRASVDQPT